MQGCKKSLAEEWLKVIFFPLMPVPQAKVTSKISTSLDPSLGPFNHAKTRLDLHIFRM